MITRESGHWNGKLVSLGGVIGGIRGRVFEGTVLALSTNIQAVVVNRPERIAAIFFNNSPVDVHITFGQPTTDYWLHLKPYQTLQIDESFPWTGSIYCYVDSSAAGYQLEIGELYLE